MDYVVLISSELYPDAIGGGGVYARYMKKALNIKVFTVKRRILLKESSVKQLNLRIPVSKHIMFLLLYPLYILDAMIFMAREKPRIVIANTVYDVLPAILMKRSFILIVHDLTMLYKGLFAKPLIRLAVKYAKALVFPSRTAYITLKPLIPDNHSIVRIISNPIDEEELCIIDTKLARRWFEKVLGVKLNNTKLILYAGSISKAKGVHILLKAFQKLCKDRNDVMLVLAGPIADKLLMENVGELDKVRYVGVFVGKRMIALLKAVDIVVNATLLNETQSRIVIEALALGKHVIASKIPATIEICKGIPQCLLFKRGDTEELYQALSKALMVSQGSMKHVMKNLLSFAKDWLSLINELLRFGL